LGVLVSRADSDEAAPADFSTPAMAREGELLLTVSAGGSPALAAVVRDHLRERIDARWVAMAGAMKELRARVLSSGAPIERRREIFRRFASEEAMGVLEAGGVERLWEWASRKAT
jgi:precorrin-2 dehydrogenase / sirohydrochlorin ferrochelatase